MRRGIRPALGLVSVGHGRDIEQQLDHIEAALGRHAVVDRDRHE